MAKTVMHPLEDSFDKGLWDDSGFVFLAILPVDVVQQTCVIIPIYKPMFIRLLQSFHVGQFNLTQWAAVLTYLNLGFIYEDILILQWVIAPLPGCKGELG